MMGIESMRKGYFRGIIGGFEIDFVSPSIASTNPGSEISPGFATIRPTRSITATKFPRIEQSHHIGIGPCFQGKAAGFG